MDSKWICVDVCTKYTRPEYYSKLFAELKAIFGDVEIVVIGDLLDDDHLDNYFGSYVFVQCNDVSAFKDKIICSKCIRTVLYSMDSPSYLTTEEINAMLTTWNNKQMEQKTNLRYGDMVKIKTGLYKNLYGIVIDRKDEEVFTVLFKFCKNYQMFDVNYINCEKMNNMFEQLKVPKL